MRLIFTLLFIFLLTAPAAAQTGIAVPELQHCDEAVEAFLGRYALPGISVAIAKDGRLIYNRAFGEADLDGREATRPDHLFRLASISKPITSIAIMNLLDENRLKLTDKVFGPGGLLEEHPGLAQATITDQRIYDITVQNLLEHSAGWDRGVNCFPNPVTPYPRGFNGCDPIVVPLHVAEQAGHSGLPTEEDNITFLLERGLDFSPNAKYVYSNIGYLVLGEVIEHLSGVSYETYVQQSLLDQLGICDMHLAKNLQENKHEREVDYAGNGYTTLSAYGTGELVPWEYGGLNVEAMDAHGGWIATARDLTRLLVAVDGFDTKPDILSAAAISTMTEASNNNAFYAKGWSVNSVDNWWHTGAIDGTATLAVRTNDGYVWAVLLNKRVVDGRANRFWSDFDNLPWNCVQGLTATPSHDLFDAPMTNSDNLTAGEVTTSGLQLSWTPGSGDRRVVVARAGFPVSAFPADGQTYRGRGQFGAGTNLGSASFVLYDGSGESVDVTNLQMGTDYYFRVFDYNVSANTGEQALYKLCGTTELKVTAGLATSVQGTGQLAGVRIYPTVVTEALTVELPSSVAAAEFTVYTSAGLPVVSGRITGGRGEISVGELPRGAYLLGVRSGDGARVIRRFIRE